MTGYVNAHTNEKVSFREWNGDKLAELLLKGVLREDILPKPLRASFQKAVAMADEPDVSYQHFAELSHLLVKAADAGDRQRVTSARQLYICLWILFVWARDIGNLEAPYRLSELALLTAWDLLRPFIGRRTVEAEAINLVLHQLIELHIGICTDLLEKKVLPHVGKRDALSLAVPTRTPTDVNLELFECLGRMAMTGLWLVWFSQRGGEEFAVKINEQLIEWTVSVFKLIENNRALFLPLRDQQAIEVCLLLLLSTYTTSGRQDAVNWLKEMTSLIDFTVRTHGKYPCVFTDYGYLIEHPREQSAAYREETTSGSILIPLVAAWLTALQEKVPLELLKELKDDVLNHCTFQLWLPDGSSEEGLYRGARDHGVALCDLPIESDGEKLLDVIAEACDKEKSFENLSAIRTGFWPIALLACKHFRLPIPPHFWIDTLRPPKNEAA